MGNIKLSDKSASQINALVAEKNKTILELKTRLEKEYTETEKRIVNAFNDKLQTFVLAIVSQIGDAEATYNLTQTKDGNYTLELQTEIKEEEKTKEVADAPIRNKRKQNV
jgi:hypothetical protein